MDDPEGAELSSRDKVLLAAMQLFGEDPAASLSVRAIAARAGVSTGSLRHHFPTQRALQDEVLTRIYDLVATDDDIHDRSIPARDRLAGCLRQLLHRAGAGDDARQNMCAVLEKFVAPEPTEELRAAYAGIERESRRRVQYWLSVLADEGALPPGDNDRRSRFLITVVNGLGLERALPTDESTLQAENVTLLAAVDWALTAPTP